MRHAEHLNTPALAALALLIVAILGMLIHAHYVSTLPPLTNTELALAAGSG